MYPFEFLFSKIRGYYNEIAQFVDNPEVIFALAMAALLVSLASLKEKR